ncbi:c-type cytochrome [Dyella nitratireducens]|uniref:Alcohol dehydrogenase n=1 Tax=Dyella nitratireducens TaxID=1849580 RepID=A0ABQ1FMJ1_9GAMM|nr:c-type cytochrome [Dyella nitratireducens]GGA21162.1 alcohol dehydrogenase [Dyella nitratireducens]GLQ44276.1 alcohol dehydrogenase [Dyella nitratireducens]
MKPLRWLWIPIVLLVIVLAGGWWLSQRHSPATASQEDPAIAAMLKDPGVIAKGRYLATAGDCGSCHTARAGHAYAGGRMLPTPFGNIPAPNITPDTQTGIGNWNFNDFWRALHDGIGRSGEPLYPAFSYTSFTNVTRDDAIAIFAYLRSLPPVHEANAALELRFPYNVRSTLAAWRAVYFKAGVYQPNASQSASWNRGAYLVQGLGHCNECHAARGAWGGLEARATLSGGQIPEQDWYAPDLSTKTNGGLQGWGRQDIIDVLKKGQSLKSAAVGPMADVVASSTQYLRDDDLQAIADYLLSLPARATPAPMPASFDSQSLIDRGNAVYTERCANCHGKDGAGVPGVYPPLDGNASVVEPTGINATRVVLLGGFPPVTVCNPRPYSMPPYAQQLSDADVAAVVTYIRHAWSNHASAVQERDVATYRHTPID